MKPLHAALAALLVIFSLAAPGFAATPSSDEIVYRSNLGRAEDVVLLIKQGASPDALDEHGTPLLALAASRKDPEGINVVKALLANGATINVRDAQGRTALFYAAKQANMDILQLLLASGIDYYAVDKGGDIARNIAHSSGHEDVVQALDGFVKDQTAKVAAQYEAANEALKARYKAIEDAQKAPLPAISPAVSPVGGSSSESSSAAAPTSEEIAAQEAEKAAAAKKLADEQEAMEKKHTVERARLAPQLALQSCIFQYWSYCHDAGQSSELSEDALLSEIKTHREQAAAIGNDMIKTDVADAAFVSKVADAAKQRIYAALNAMPSKAYRHEFGVGKKDDMTKRCKAIAEQWDSDAPIPSAAPPVSKPAKHPQGGVYHQDE